MPIVTVGSSIGPALSDVGRGLADWEQTGRENRAYDFAMQQAQERAAREQREREAMGAGSAALIQNLQPAAPQADFAPMQSATEGAGPFGPSAMDKAELGQAQAMHTDLATQAAEIVKHMPAKYQGQFVQDVTGRVMDERQKIRGGQAARTIQAMGQKLGVDDAVLGPFLEIAKTDPDRALEMAAKAAKPRIDQMATDLRRVEVGGHIQKQMEADKATGHVPTQDEMATLVNLELGADPDEVIADYGLARRGLKKTQFGPLPAETADALVAQAQALMAENLRLKQAETARVRAEAEAKSPSGQARTFMLRRAEQSAKDKAAMDRTKVNADQRGAAAAMQANQSLGRLKSRDDQAREAAKAKLTEADQALYVKASDKVDAKYPTLEGAERKAKIDEEYRLLKVQAPSAPASDPVARAKAYLEKK